MIFESNKNCHRFRISWNGRADVGAKAPEKFIEKLQNFSISEKARNSSI